MSAVHMTPPKPVQRWQADDYALKGRFVSELARPVLDLLAPRQGERILDLGCGDGVLTQEIADARRRRAWRRFERGGARRGCCKGPQSAKGGRPCASLRGRVRRGVHQCGAALDAPARARDCRRPPGASPARPNLAAMEMWRAIATAIRAVGALHGGDPDKVAPWFFPSVAEYRRLLEQGGFAVKAIILVPRPTPLDIGIRGWLETFGRSFFEQFEEPERAEVFSEVIELLRPALCDADGVWTADHIRLRFSAERAG
jgi:hypothetical protein